MLPSTYPIEWLAKDWLVNRWLNTNRRLFEDLRKGKTEQAVDRYVPLDRVYYLAGVYGMTAEEMLVKLVEMAGNISPYSLELSSPKDDVPRRVILSINA